MFHGNHSVNESPWLCSVALVVKFPVQWGDQDAFGHVNNTVYVRWFEASRIAYFTRIGILTTFDTERIGPIVAAININFRRSATYPDNVEVGARVTRIGRSSLSIEHKIYSHSLGAICAEGDSTLVVYNYAEQKSIAVPDRVRKVIEELEGQAFCAGRPIEKCQLRKCPLISTLLLPRGRSAERIRKT